MSISEDSAERRVRALMAEGFGDIVHVSAAGKEDDLFLGGAEVNSFTMVSLAVRLEDEFGMELAPEDFRGTNFKSIGSVVALVLRTLGDRDRSHEELSS